MTLETNKTTTTTTQSSTSPKIPKPGHDELYSIFTKHQKALIVTVVALAATLSGLASNIYFPALPTIAKDLHVSVELVNLTVTSYMIFQGIAPSFWAALADVKGRRITYVGTLIVLLGACIGLAETRSYAQLIVLRCLQSTGSSSTIAIGAGVIGDITTRAERGGYMGVFQAGLLVPTAIGPVIGGAMSGALGWRSIFWFLTIYCGVIILLLIVLLPETLRLLVGNGSLHVTSVATRYPLAWFQHRNKIEVKDVVAVPTTRDVDRRTSPRPRVNILSSFRILIGKDVVCIILFLAIYFAVWQMSITAFSSLLKSQYGLSDFDIGLTYLANGTGAIVGTLITGRLLDIEYRRLKARATQSHQPFSIAKARLRIAYAWGSMQCCAILIFGWTMDKHVHVAVPIVSTFFTGWAITSIGSTVNTFLVDVYPDRSASASAALNLARCLIGAGGTALVTPIINGIGAGWCFTLLSAILVLALGLVVLQLRISSEEDQETDLEVREEGSRSIDNSRV